VDVPRQETPLQPAASPDVDLELSMSSEEPVTFADLGILPELAAALNDAGILQPFPIQALTIPDALAGLDIAGKAPTGSGKTLAFGIPTVARVSKAQSKAPHAVILVPTRELASQVATNLEPLAAAMHRTVLTIYGGVGFENQLQALRKGVDILVATPGRLNDLVQQNALRLDAIEIVVLDEADRMADMGFLPQVRRILDKTPKSRQTLLFSATLDGDVNVLVKRYQNDPVMHDIIGDESKPEIDHHFWKVDKSLRPELVAEIVMTSWPAVVFSRTKHGADKLVRDLRKLGVSAEAIHGDLSQSKRERALASFMGGKTTTLVATDVAARGIHVDDVACVVHYDLPETFKDYTHRSGRTGRAGARGTVVALVVPEQLSDARRLVRQADLQVTVVDPDFKLLRASEGEPVAHVEPIATTERAKAGGESRRPRRPRNRSTGRKRNSSRS
jgi:superfamily II DNA/RNA helicase